MSRRMARPYASARSRSTASSTACSKFPSRCMSSSLPTSMPSGSLDSNEWSIPDGQRPTANGQLLRQRHHERRPFARLVLDLYVAAMKQYDMFGDGQAEAAAGDELRARFIDAVE